MAWKKLVWQNNPAPANKIDSMFSSETCFGTEFRLVISSAEWFGTEFRAFATNFLPWYRIPSIFLLCRTVRNWIPRIFCSVEQPEFRRNKPVVPRNSQNSAGTNLLFRGTAGIPPEQTCCSVYSVFRGIIFCRKLPTLIQNQIEKCE